MVRAPRNPDAVRAAVDGDRDDLRLAPVRRAGGGADAARDRRRAGAGRAHARTPGRGRRSGASRCRRSAGRSSTASCSRLPAASASTARSPSSPATSRVRPRPRLCASRMPTRTSTSPGAYGISLVLAVLSVAVLVAMTLLKPQEGRVSISVRNVSKRFGDFQALDDVSVEVGSGSLTALLGPSRLRQVDAAADRGRARAARRRRDPSRGRGRDDRDAAEARRRIRLPALRSVQAHDGAQQHRVRAEDPQAPAQTRCAPASTSCSRSYSSRGSATAIRRNSRAASASGWRLRAHSHPSLRCCCSTSPSAHSTRASVPSSGNGCSASTPRRTRRPCSSRTTRKRRWRWPTTSS